MEVLALRHLRNIGNSRDDIDRLADNAWRNVEAVCERIGWEFPRRTFAETLEH